jgi:hypothetical protein
VCGCDEQLQCGVCVGDDAVVGCEDAADLSRFDVDVHEGAALAEDVESAGGPVGPPVADAQDEVGLQHGGVAVAVGGLEPCHARHEGMVVGDRAPAHQGGDDRDVEGLGEFDQQVGGAGVDDAAARVDHGAFRCAEHVQRLVDLSPTGGRLVDGEWCVGVRVEVDLGHLHVERQVEQHRSGSSGAHQVERLLERARHLTWFEDGRRPLGHRFGDGGDVDGLEVLLVQAGDRCLPGDAQDRD